MEGLRAVVVLVCGPGIKSGLASVSPVPGYTEFCVVVHVQVAGTPAVVRWGLKWVRFAVVVGVHTGWFYGYVDAS